HPLVNRAIPCFRRAPLFFDYPRGGKLAQCDVRERESPFAPKALAERQFSAYLPSDSHTPGQLHTLSLECGQSYIHPEEAQKVRAQNGLSHEASSPTRQACSCAILIF